MSNLFLTLSDIPCGYEISLRITNEKFRKVTRSEHFSPFTANSDDLINFLDPILQTLIDNHAVERVYTFGDHRILRKLNSLLTVQQIVDIRDSRIDQNCLIDLDSPYSSYFIGCENSPQSRGIKVIPDDVSESINNLCFLISKNIVNGYDIEKGCMYFNVKKQFPMFCTTHCSMRTTSRCTLILSEMNIFKFTVLTWARKLLYRLDGKYELVEFILQCVFLNLAFPHEVRYSSSTSYFDIYISDVLVMSVMAVGNCWWIHPEFWGKYVKYIRKNISTFNTAVLQLDKVVHDSFLIDRLEKIMDAE